MEQSTRMRTRTRANTMHILTPATVDVSQNVSKNNGACAISDGRTMSVFVFRAQPLPLCVLFY